MAAFFLAALACCVLALAANAAHQRATEAYRQLGKSNDALMGAHSKLLELAEVGHVAAQLQRHGVGAYLLTANERIAEDVTAIMQHLGLDREDAVEYLKNGLVRPKTNGAERREPVSD